MTRGKPRGDSYESSIPEPSKRELDEAASKGVDIRTGFPVQPMWCSVLKKRQAPFSLVRWIFCNCFCHPRWTLTRAQWLWFMNLVLFIVYSYFSMLVWWETSEKGSGFLATVMRQKVSYEAVNVSGSTGGYTVTLIDNKMPIRIDMLTNGVFFVSAVVHLFVVVLGPFDRWIFFLWRQLDLCFVYWRWIDFGITFPMMMMVLCCITELRDENTLASIWMLCVGSVTCFFLTELWSRPMRNSDNTYDMSRWKGDDPVFKPETPSNFLSTQELVQRTMQKNRRRANFVIRTTPITLGIFPYVAAWWIFLNHFYDSRSDIRVDPTDHILQRTPQFMQMLVYGTLIFSVFHFLTSIWFQWQPPMHHWRSEIVNSLLSLTFKLFFGLYMYEHVLTKETLVQALVPL